MRGAAVVGTLRSSKGSAEVRKNVMQRAGTPHYMAPEMVPKMLLKSHS